MSPAAVSHTDDNMFTAWQATNGASWCHRMSATISRKCCENNQRRSTDKYGNLSCQGCGGLDNQDQYPERKPLTIVWNAEKEPEDCLAHDDGTGAEIGTANQRGCHLDDEELDALLAGMFPTDDQEDDISEDEQEWTYIEDPPAPRVRRVAVYMGRCARCGNGYMDNVLEAQFDVHDEDIYRCLACGWRTSPQYENNRALFAAGGVI